MRQMLHDGRPPLVETGLAKHAFPPYGCGSLHTPQYVVRREGNHLLCQKTSPCKGDGLVSASPCGPGGLCAAEGGTGEAPAGGRVASTKAEPGDLEQAG